MLRSDSTPRALTIRACSRSECVPKPRRVESTPDSAARRRWTICSAAISTEKMPTVACCRAAAFRAKLRAREVLPTLGRAATTMMYARLSAHTSVRGHGRGAGEHVADVGARVVGHLGDLPGGADQPSIGGVALDERGVVLHADGGGELCDQAAQVGGAAYLL